MIHNNISTGVVEILDEAKRTNKSTQTSKRGEKKKGMMMEKSNGRMMNANCLTGDESMNQWNLLIFIFIIGPSGRFIIIIIIIGLSCFGQLLYRKQEGPYEVRESGHVLLDDTSFVSYAFWWRIKQPSRPNEKQANKHFKQWCFHHCCMDRMSRFHQRRQVYKSYFSIRHHHHHHRQCTFGKET